MRDNAFIDGIGINWNIYNQELLIIIKIAWNVRFLLLKLRYNIKFMKVNNFFYKTTSLCLWLEIGRPIWSILDSLENYIKNFD